jgi:hypothetical protein
MKINMKNSTGILKQVKLGFSWTMLFFGFLVPLIRGDFKWAIISFIIAFITCGISWLVLPFLYNKIYIKDMLVKGWMPADEAAANALRAKDIYVPEIQQ